MDPFDELNKPKLDETERRTMAFEIYRDILKEESHYTKGGLLDLETVTANAFEITDEFIDKYLKGHAR